MECVNGRMLPGLRAVARNLDLCRRMRSHELGRMGKSYAQIAQTWPSVVKLVYVRQREKAVIA